MNEKECAYCPLKISEGWMYESYFNPLAHPPGVPKGEIISLNLHCHGYSAEQGRILFFCSMCTPR